MLIGLALRGAGIWGPSAVYDYDWQLRPAENRAAGRVPAPAAIVAGRIVGATAGWVACLALWGLGGALQRDQGGTRRDAHVGTTRWTHLGGGGVASRAGAAGALLLASHPLWLANARRAGLDAPALALGLLAALLAVWALRRRAPPAPLLPLLLAGALAGLAVGTKYVALLALPAALVPFAAALRGASGRARGALLVGAPLSLLVAGMVFWATNPALYPDPPGGLRVSLDFLTTQAAGMRWRSPVFQYPALVAVEVIDRAVWPLGFPAVVDQTLPEPLRPGSYGTPAVALGALAGLLALARPAAPRSDSRSATAPGARLPHLTAAVWTGVVYLALVCSVPIWWERWHLPLVLPLCLLAGLGLAWLGRGNPALILLPAVAQLIAALAMGPSYLGRGFGALLGTPLGAGVQVLALTVLLVHFCAGSARLAWGSSARHRTPAPGAHDTPTGEIDGSVREHARQG